MIQIWLTLSTLLDRFTEKRDDRGATAVEYGLMVALIAAVIVGVVSTIGQTLLAKFTIVSNAI